MLLQIKLGNGNNTYIGTCCPKHENIKPALLGYNQLMKRFVRLCILQIPTQFQESFAEDICYTKLKV